MRKLLLHCYVMLIIGTLVAQPDTLPLAYLSAMEARSIGPAAMSGRVNAIARDANNGNLFIGAASGGVWKSTDEGASWQPIFDKAPTQAVGSLALNPNTSDEIWVGTGEGNPRNSHNSGIGLFHTLDGGKSWQSAGLENTKTIHRIIVHPQASQTLVVGALGAAWGPNPDRGVFKTTDGGKTWRKTLFINDSTGCADLVVDPRNPNKLIAAMWEFGRKPWFLQSGGPGSGLYVSLDGGETWKKRDEKNGLPEEVGRIGLAIAPSNPEIVYALVETPTEQGFYKSTNGGQDFTKTHSSEKLGGRPFYFSEIHVDPQNENRIYSIHTTITKSEDGGIHFENYVPWQEVHPDHHAFYIDPKDPNYIVCGNDGGLAISRDRGENWSFMPNLPLGQFYHINVDNQTPYNIYGGLQDNGSWVGPSEVWRNGGIRNSDWQEVLFGDGFDVMPWPDNPRYGYAMYQGGELNFWDRETGFNEYIKPVHPKGEPLRFNWNAALAQDPFHACGVYYGSQFLHYSRDCGNEWLLLSPDLTTNDTAKQIATQSGGYTPDVTAAENYTTLLSIAPSTLDSNLIWVGTDDGKVQLTRDQGKNWSNLASRLPGLPAGAWIPQIQASVHNAGEAFVIANNYRRNDWQPYAYHTTDFGATWRRIANSDQIKGHCLSIVQDPEVPQLLFLGTENGLWISINKGQHWNQYKVGDFPSVPVQDLIIQAAEADLVIGTFGRSIWIIDDIRPLRELAKDKTIKKSKLALLNSRDGILAEWRSVNGPRFPGVTEYQGDNTGPYIPINIWCQPDSAAADSVKTELTLYILDLQGDTIRTLKPKADTGLVRADWNLDRKGIAFPSWKEPQKDQEPGGLSVLPGKYNVFAVYGSATDSMQVEVFTDPRLPLSINQLKDRYAAQLNFLEVVTASTAAFDRLKEAKKIIKNVEASLAQVPDSSKTALTKQGLALQDSITAMQKRFILEPNTRGIVDDSKLLNTYLYVTMGYISSSTGQPGVNVRQAEALARKEVALVLNDINMFFDRDWKKYRTEVEALARPTFKEFVPLTLPK